MNPNNIELRYLRYFIILAEELNYGRAAKRLHVSTPALSMLIKKLEGILDVRLLDRNCAKASLTPAGETLLQHSQALQSRMREALERTKNAARAQRPSLSVGVPDFVNFNLVAETLGACRQTMPGVRITLHDFATAEAQHAALDEKRLHLGFFPETYLKRMKDIAHLPAFDLPLCAVMSKSHPLAAHPQTTLAGAARHPLLATDSLAGHARNMRETFEAAHIAPRPIATTHGLSNLLAMLATGNGVTLMLRHRLRARAPGLVTRPVRGARLRVHAVWKPAAETPPLLAYVDTLRQTLRQTQTNHQQTTKRFHTKQHQVSTNDGAVPN